MASGMILAAGLGTRLRPLTDELPKPLVPLGDRPMIAHAAARLAAAGVAPLAFNVHHLADAFASAALDGLGLVALREPRILGTAGGVANARRVLGPGEVVVWNGDLAADLDVGALLGAHVARGLAATLAVAPRPRGEGTVGLDAGGRVVRLRGER
ncbi:MAG TPA: sugar phosphate nucleotidyltransferase, partial [Minicystis sp.]|nr:sugar phosphate nucleotidyltransferase [Minicystis sp.]